MQIGQTQDLIVGAEMSKFSDRVKINEGINTHRVLNGPFLARSVYWPTLVNDQGQMNQRMKSVIVPKMGSELLRSLADNEKEFRRGLGETDPRSQFAPSNTYLYLIFNRDEVVAEGESPKVRVAAYKQTVYSRLVEIQNERSTKDSTKLKNGLIFMYDVQIKKTIGDPSKARFTTKYTVDVDSENNKVMGVIPVELLEMSPDKMMKVVEENRIWDHIMTPLELEAIEECQTNLADDTRANTEEEILLKLKDSPIFLGAKDSNSGQFLFPQNEQFIQFLKSKELPILDAAAQTQLPEAAKQPTTTPPVNISTEPTTGSPPATEPVTADPAAEKKEVVVETGPPKEVHTESGPAAATPAVEVATEVKPENKDQPLIRWGDKPK